MLQQVNIPQRILNVLKKNHLSVTESRVSILELFYKNDDALSHSDIERHTAEKFDRVTIYRTLQTFVEKGILHTIPTSGNTILYALCTNNCREGHHEDNHIHFICNNCGRTYCLNHAPMPKVQLPEDFIWQQTDVLVSGICNRCHS
jgi:Fur family ferric uptake transcriptional regulator